VSCEHYFVPDENNKFDGHGHCLKCGQWEAFMFMDNKLQAAKALATRAHEGQKRKYTGEPYIKHPEDVYILVSWLIENENWEPELALNVCCAAWLHDVLEDCPQITEQEILDATGPEVLALVKELTNPSKGVKAPRAVRKQMDRDHLAVVSKEAKVIKLADRICNLRDIEQGDKDFIPLYTAESRALLEVLKGTNEVLEGQLLQKIEFYESGTR
jgi:(p)ppGpp synthase/HD superfamily hydrolase